jgi:hypothetical protein
MTKKSKEQEDADRAKMVVPPNELKEKVGDGGFDEKMITRAQHKIEKNAFDFLPIAAPLMGLMDQAIADIRSGALQGEMALRTILHPVMQLRAQGGMFHYPLVTDICDILANFLETVKAPDKDVLEIVLAHKTALNVVLTQKLKDGQDKTGRALCTALTDSCERYSRAKASK